MSINGARYRFVGRKGYRTRWRPLPQNGIPKPSRQTRQRLGDGFAYEVIMPPRQESQKESQRHR
jgi:hypothetical protein